LGKRCIRSKSAPPFWLTITSEEVAIPLHDWTDRAGWDGVHHLWITELLRWVKPQLPEGYRAYIGTAPVVAVGAPAERPDVGVRGWSEASAPAGSASANGPGAAAKPLEEPDEEIAVATIEPGKALYVEAHGRLVSAVELVSPRNEDRPVARDSYLTRYLGYILEGVHVLLVDVHRRPVGFCFADRIGQELQIKQPPCPSPFAVSYRVGEPIATGGRLLAIWRRPLNIGQALPVLPLALTVQQAVSVDLEQTYSRAAADAYLP
jgi:uncharacterized protein DUF4058